MDNKKIREAFRNINKQTSEQSSIVFTTKHLENDVQYKLICKECNFSQDYFWEDGYNPIGELIELEDKLFDEKWSESKDYIIRALEVCINKINSMWWRTQKELNEKNPLYLCPICNKKLIIE